MNNVIVGVLVCCLVALTGRAYGDRVTLVNNGVAKCAIVVPAGSMRWKGDDKPLSRWSPWSQEPERRRRLQRDSVLDLAHYLEKISGAKIEIVQTVPSGDERVPIYIGSAAEKVFGPVGIDFAKDFGFRVVANDQGVGLYGESEYGTSYAIYELLDRLGCRWYMPSEMGECIPSMPTILIRGDGSETGARDGMATDAGADRRRGLPPAQPHGRGRGRRPLRLRDGTHQNI